ncbi:serine O-acetyltransferase [Phyllobacterium sp. P30BS-XVII]|uniref:serine O-acetyltransferase n=1 Tax=Phyllobacterium sp. P30BS-XVII TaxID=2587046 RepID=UPI000DDCA2BA|nr:serine O-acetyltransferase [Phyllobacterium sp. P30BS-XVII]MBA8901717.1 serine O-acetyltransferase [Phyllobacterium sp. P30BS-XVII]
MTNAAVTSKSRSLWSRILSEAVATGEREPTLAPVLQRSVIRFDRLEHALCFQLAEVLAGQLVTSERLFDLFSDLLQQDPTVLAGAERDINAVLERDPATKSALHVLLYLKGFHAIQIHRFAHLLWGTGREDLAAYLQSRSSRILQVDIHPAVRLGKGVFFDHATGIVIGETAVIEDNVSILQGVTLGGTGKDTGDRHPKVRHGVLIGANATVLGNIEIGVNSKIGAGSVVLKSVENRKTVAGVPAKVIGGVQEREPARSMNQILYDVGL